MKDNLKIFLEQARENIHSIDLQLTLAKAQLNRLEDYRDEITRDRLVGTLKISQELNKWIIDNATELKLYSRIQSNLGVIQ